MSFFELVLSPYKQYANFKGRANRAEFWLFVLSQLFFAFLGTTFCKYMVLTQGVDLFAWFNMVYMLAFITPTLALVVRRSHDFNYQPAFIIACYIVFMTINYFFPMLPGYQVYVSVNPVMWFTLNYLLSIPALLFCTVMGFILALLKGNEGENQHGPVTSTEQDSKQKLADETATLSTVS